MPFLPHSLSLAEVCAAAELMLAQDEAEAEMESSDEGFGEEESDCEEGGGELSAADRSLADSGYGGAGTPPTLSKESR